MSKMKTNRSAAKRFKKTATGKYKYYHSGKSHILTKKSPKRKRHLRKPGIIGPDDHQRVRRLLGGGRAAPGSGKKEERRPSVVPNEQHDRIMELLKGQG